MLDITYKIIRKDGSEEIKNGKFFFYDNFAYEIKKLKEGESFEIIERKEISGIKPTKREAMENAEVILDLLELGGLEDKIYIELPDEKEDN